MTLRYTSGIFAGPLLLLVLHLGCAGPGTTQSAPAQKFAAPYARLERIAQVSFQAGPFTEARPGDYLLENERLRVVISGTPRPTTFAVSAGNILDLAPQGGPDAIREVFTFFNREFPRQARYDSVFVLEGLTDAVALTALGEDVANPGLAVETVYLLRAGSDALEITTRLFNRSTEPVSEFALGDAIQWGTAEPFAPGPGFELQGTDLEIPFLTAGFQGVAYLWDSPGGSLRGPHGPGWSDPVIRTVTLAPGDTTSYVRRLGVFAHPHDAIRAGWESSGVRPGVYHVLIQDPRGFPVQGARVEAVSATGTVLAWDLTGPEGEGWLFTPPGDHTIRVTHPERGSAAHPRIGAEVGETQTVHLRLGAPGRMVLQSHGSVPARWELHSERHSRTRFHAGQSDTLLLPAGTYRVAAMRGPDSPVWSREVTVEAGGTVVVEAAIEPSLLPPGWISADLHVHSFPSADSNVLPGERLRAAPALGIDWFANTEHRVAANWDTLGAIPGVELAFAGGHLSAFPVTAGTEAFADAGPGTELGGLLSRIREREPRAVLMLNHPRSGGDGYFDAVEFNPETLEARSSYWTDFDLLEVWNGARPAGTERAFADWMALLGTGKRILGVGGSDSHTLEGGGFGLPRTYVHCGPSRPETPEAFARLVLQGNLFVSNGPLIEFELAGASPGQTREVSPGAASGHVRVLAAPHVDVARVVVVVNGKTDAIYPVRGRGAVRFDQQIDVHVKGSSFVLIRAEGDEPLEYAAPPGIVDNFRRPLAFTNPIWLEIPRASR